VNYRHAYHAGNFADVVKHLALVAVIDALVRKDKPVFVLDAHAGAGLYALAAEASKTGEWRDGIGRVAAAPAPPPLVARYLERVAGFNPPGALELYPGSPALAAGLLRPSDRLALVELHPEDAAALRAQAGRDGRIAVHERDAWEALRGLLPPTPRRGLVLVDPPFEVPGEFGRMARAVGATARRWPEGVQIHWYPVKDRGTVDGFLAAAAEGAPAGTLVAELTLFDALFPSRLNGCGLILVNLPYGVAEALSAALAWVQPVLARAGGGWTLRALGR
jgi:23S rRNA (adenine2030-N6)-methyltransferase